MKKVKVRPKEERMPVEVTALVLCYNSPQEMPRLGYFGMMLLSLECGRQSVPMKLLLVENGSDDGVQLVVRELGKDTPTRRRWMSRGFTGITVIEVPHNEEYPPGAAQTYYNMRECWRAAGPLIDTPYVLTVDSDVELPAGAVRSMLEVWKTEENIGVVGLQYDWEGGHVKSGAAMWRTDDFRKMLPHLEIFRGSGAHAQPICPCGQMNEMLTNEGKRCVHIDGLSARHYRWEV